MIWEVCGEGEAAARGTQADVFAELARKRLLPVLAYPVTNVSSRAMMSSWSRYGIEHVTGLSSVARNRGVDRSVSLPTLWRPIGVKKYLNGLSWSRDISRLLHLRNTCRRSIVIEIQLLSSRKGTGRLAHARPLPGRRAYEGSRGGKRRSVSACAPSF